MAWRGTQKSETVLYGRLWSDELSREKEATEGMLPLFNQEKALGSSKVRPAGRGR